MRENISNYKLLEKRLIGQTLKLFFCVKTSDQRSKVLELIEVAGFRDYLSHSQTSLSVEIREGGSSYGFDISLRTGKEEVHFFDEVFLFENETVAHWKFRAVARKIMWRDVDDVND